MAFQRVVPGCVTCLLSCREMLFWTKEEYLRFAEVMMDRPIFYYAFEVLYWCGIREGELLALTPADFDFEKQILRIDKNFQRIGKRDVIQTTKTKYSNRTIKIPKFLCEEMQDCLKQFYHIKEDDRIFPLTKHRLYTAMKSGSEQAGVKKIRVHDLRHSHVSFLINSGFSAFEIGQRVGHSAEKITLRYAHLFPGKQESLANFLEKEWNKSLKTGMFSKETGDQAVKREEGNTRWNRRRTGSLERQLCEWTMSKTGRGSLPKRSRCFGR